MDDSALRERYAGYDRDGDGYIDFGEFSALLDELGLGYSETQTRAAFDSLDVDKNGQIDFGEFKIWWVE
ncbi:MAG TPA: EF-hand domain-containing protein [Polyangiaceae bacterium]|jgi:Ca2+-binding EF-hand superfamily protein|nr:EF-hand domain-containing protein [Polyangiaceae bacterium]